MLAAESLPSLLWRSSHPVVGESHWQTSPGGARCGLGRQDPEVGPSSFLWLCSALLQLHVSNVCPLVGVGMAAAPWAGAVPTSLGRTAVAAWCTCTCLLRGPRVRFPGRGRLVHREHRWGVDDLGHSCVKLPRHGRQKMRGAWFLQKHGLGGSSAQHRGTEESGVEGRSAREEFGLCCL